MSLRKIFNNARMSELDRKVSGNEVTISNKLVSITVSLSDWNRLGLDTKI